MEDSASAMIEAEIRERFQAKTHMIFVSRVQHAEVTDIEPKVYMARRFCDGDILAFPWRDSHLEFPG